MPSTYRHDFVLPSLRFVGGEKSPRGAVGGCSTPGSRVDPWWNPGSLFPSTPGPPRIDEGAPDNSSGAFHPCSPPSPSQRHPHHQPNACRNASTPYAVSPNLPPSCSAPGTRPADAVVAAPVVYGIASSPPQPSSSSSSSSSSSASSSAGNLILSALLATTSSEAQHENSGEGADPLNGILSSLNVRIKTEEYPKIRAEERRAGSSISSSPSSAFNASLLTSLLSTSSRIPPCQRQRGDTDQPPLLRPPCAKLEYPPPEATPAADQEQRHRQQRGGKGAEGGRGARKPDYPQLVVGQSSREAAGEEALGATSPYDAVSGRCGQGKQGGKGGSLAKDGVAPPCAVSPSSDLVVEMKYETQSGPPAAPPHLSSAGVEPPHSSQGTGLVVGGSPAEVVGVDSLLLSPWGATGPDFLEPPDVKQTAAGLQDAWDTLLLGSSVGVASAQSLAELKPLPPFTGYTGHLSINGIPGHHYHTIASSAQRPSLPSSSPTSSSNQEYYESPVVSSSTPCPQGTSQKQQQQQQQQQQHQHQQHQQQQQQHQHHQQQLPQSSQPVDYDIEDIAEIIGSAIADTTVPGGGNGPGSEHDPEASRDWIDIADWIDTACSPKAQETTSPSPYSQIYGTATPSTQAQQHGSTLQSLLTHGYAPLINARLQSANAALQNTSCGETPSSTSPYPPVSPPGRVSTSCSPDHLLHSSFAAPSHPRKRSRPAPASQNPSKKSPAATALPYGTESGLIGGKEKPVHRCSICNRGFLNKSNIKVHLRTHTGEKPFRCEVCGKAFRQKAHLIKHQQIHKRIGRD